MERRLAAILAADVVGYSRLVGEDEEGTLRTLGACREVIDGLVTDHHGRVFSSAGDSVVAEFASPVEAVRCAADIQRDLERRNADLPEDRRMRFRIGINLGDVIVEGDNLLGDGVNVAARLETLADAGGICLSRAVFDQIRKKLELGYEYLGEQEVKNIAEPVRVYRVLLDPEASGTVIGEAKPATQPWKWAALTAAMVLVIGAVVVVAWLRPWAPDVEPASVERMAFAPSDKPSIAVLPFANLSGDPEQEYFADGMTDDLITDLSRVAGLFVIARNSVFTYKGTAVNVQEVARELGVRFVLEGSVRRAEGKVRINVQLIDATTGGHLWAERFDRDYVDIFALQDEVIGKIVTALAVELTDAEQARLTRRPTENLEAYELYLRAEQGVYSYDRILLAVALSNYEKATALDPKFAEAHAGYARVAAEFLRLDQTAAMPADVARERAYERVTRALALNPDLSRAHFVLGVLQLVDGQHGEAIESARKAVSLDPNNAEGYANLALVLAYSGRPAEASAAMEVGLRLNPKAPAGFHLIAGEVWFIDRQYDRAIGALTAARDAFTGCKPCQGGARLQLAMTYAQLDRLDEAKAEIKIALVNRQWWNLGYVRQLYAYYRRDKDLNHRLDALRKAGLPEWPAGYEGRVKDRLEGPALEALLFGQTWFGRSQIDFGAFGQKTSEEGSVKYRASGKRWEGTASVKGDMLCYRFPAVLMGQEFCGYVYRNPDGTPEDRNEYIAADVFDVYYFSLKQ